MWWGRTLVCYREVTLVSGGDRLKRHVLTSGSGNASVWAMREREVDEVFSV
jgi:hypothetical protein